MKALRLTKVRENSEEVKKKKKNSVHVQVVFSSANDKRLLTWPWSDMM
jgi:hypothetical protein